LDTHYASPIGYDWESLEHPSTPVTNDNIQAKSDAFVSILRERKTYYQTQHVLVLMGEDFRFQNASLQFENMDYIVQYIRNHPQRYNGDSFTYSTVREYKKALLSAISSNNKNHTIPVITGSPFLPLWAGYYTQIPNLKQMVRTCECRLRTCEVHLFQALKSDGSCWP
jgi:hypothetical protein